MTITYNNENQEHVWLCKQKHGQLISFLNNGYIFPRGQY